MNSPLTTVRDMDARASAIVEPLILLSYNFLLEIKVT